MSKQDLKLTGAQLCVAGQVLGYSHVLLPGDPFQGWLVEEISAELEKAQEELTQEGLIKQPNEGEATLATGLYSVVEAIGAPERSLLLNHSAPDESQRVWYLHQANGDWVGLEYLEDEEYQLGVLTEKKKLRKRLLDFLEISNQSAASGDICTIPNKALLEARRVAAEEGSDACVAYLTKAGVEKENREHFAKALAEPQASGSLIALLWEGKQSQQVGGMAFIASEDGLWQLRPETEIAGWVAASPISGKDLSKQVESLLEMVS